MELTYIGNPNPIQNSKKQRFGYQKPDLTIASVPMT